MRSRWRSPGRAGRSARRRGGAEGGRRRRDRDALDLPRALGACFQREHAGVARGTRWRARGADEPHDALREDERRRRRTVRGSGVRRAAARPRSARARRSAEPAGAERLPVAEPVHGAEAEERPRARALAEEDERGGLGGDASEDPARPPVERGQVLLGLARQAEPPGPQRPLGGGISSTARPTLSSRATTTSRSVGHPRRLRGLARGAVASRAPRRPPARTASCRSARRSRGRDVDPQHAALVLPPVHGARVPRGRLRAAHPLRVRRLRGDAEPRRLRRWRSARTRPWASPA